MLNLAVCRRGQGAAGVARALHHAGRGRGGIGALLPESAWGEHRPAVRAGARVPPKRDTRVRGRNPEAPRPVSGFKRTLPAATRETRLLFSSNSGCGIFPSAWAQKRCCCIASVGEIRDLGCPTSALGLQRKTPSGLGPPDEHTRGCRVKLAGSPKRMEGLRCRRCGALATRATASVGHCGASRAPAAGGAFGRISNNHPRRIAHARRRRRRYYGGRREAHRSRGDAPGGHGSRDAHYASRRGETG